MFRIHKLDIPRITCNSMSLIQAHLIHSSCVYTGEIALVFQFSTKFGFEDDPSIISCLPCFSYHNGTVSELPKWKLASDKTMTGLQQPGIQVHSTKITLVWNKTPEAHVACILASQYHLQTLSNCCTTCYDIQPYTLDFPILRIFYNRVVCKNWPN